MTVLLELNTNNELHFCLQQCMYVHKMSTTGGMLENPGMLTFTIILH
jgi:hypothetical protein